jgi:hypothetical protein
MTRAKYNANPLFKKNKKKVEDPQLLLLTLKLGGPAWLLVVKQIQ